jgi:hypothetical protein
VVTSTVAEAAIATGVTTETVTTGTIITVVTTATEAMETVDSVVTEAITIIMTPTETADTTATTAATAIVADSQDVWLDLTALTMQGIREATSLKTRETCSTQIPTSAIVQQALLATTTVVKAPLALL